MVAILLAASGSMALGDWVETNNDAEVAGRDLDYEDYWVAIDDGSGSQPVRNWFTAGELATAGFGSDDGWTGNVIEITDDANDARIFAAENTWEPFTDVRVTVATSTYDTDEEFGAMARASYFEDDYSIDTLNAYAATFSANNAGSGDPMKFTLYKIVGGDIDVSLVASPLAESYDDYIVSIELEVVGGMVTARLFEDTGDAGPIAELILDDSSSPLPAGYSGVLCLDLIEADGIGVLYDTLESVAIPEPGILTLLVAGLGVVLLPICRLRRRRS